MYRKCGIYTYTREYYSAVTKKILPLAKIWMELEGIMPSEIRQKEKDKHCMISRVEPNKTPQNPELIENGLVVARGKG